MELEATLSGLFTLSALASGLYLYGKGQSPGTLVFIHRLAAYGAGIFAGQLIGHLLKDAHPSPATIAALIVAGLATFGLFISGALIRNRQHTYEHIRRIHNITAVLAVGFVVAGALLLK